MLIPSGDADIGEGLSGKLEMALHVLADDRLLVVAPDVVPLDPVPVEVVQHCHAGLRLTVLEMYLKTENSDYAVKLIHSFSSWLGMQNC